MFDPTLSLPTAVNLIFFVCFALGVWHAGSRLTYLADALSDRLKLAKSTVGLIFLAAATSLPEIATTITAAIEQNAELVLNNLFGGIALQTAILGVADLWARGAISNYPRKANHALEATLLVGLLGVAQMVLILNEPFSIFWVGMGSVLIACIYASAIALLRHFDGNPNWVPVDLPSDVSTGSTALPLSLIYNASSTARLIGLSVLFCFAILILGIGLVWSADALAVQTGLGASFVGATLLAASTSLPELTTTITAVRMGSYTLAISNVFGSNLIMLVLVLPADILYLEGPILSGASRTVHLAIVLGIAVTVVYLIGFIVKRKPSVGRIGIDSLVVLGTYLAGVVAFYLVR